MSYRYLKTVSVVKNNIGTFIYNYCIMFIKLFNFYIFEWKNETGVKFQHPTIELMIAKRPLP